MNLRWQTSELAGALYAADLVRRGVPPTDAALADALAGPVARLQETLLEERVPPAAFWNHVAPLAANKISMQELASLTLVKCIGQTESSVRVIRFRELLYAIRDAAALPSAEEPPPLDLEPLRGAWARYGAGLLARIVECTDPDLLVEEATVVGLAPVRGGGGGAAHLAYNLACIEIVPESDNRLPEVIRLAWLLAPLNLDLPIYGEKVRGHRLPLVATLALLPVTLAAATELQLTRAAPDLLADTLRDWLPDQERHGQALAEWWSTYQRLKPSWSNALKALDLLLE